MTIDVPADDVEFAETNDDDTIGKLASGDEFDHEVVVDTDRLRTMLDEVDEESRDGIVDLAVFENPEVESATNLLVVRDRDTGSAWALAGVRLPGK